MLKKKILGIFIIGLGFLGITYGFNDITYNQSKQVTYYITDLPGSGGYLENTYILNNVNSNLSFENNQITYYSNAGNPDRYYTFGRVNGKPYAISQYSNSIIYEQGYMENLCIANYYDYSYLNCYGNLDSQRENVNKNISYDKYAVITPGDATQRLPTIGALCFISTTNDYVFCFSFRIGSTPTNFFSQTGNLVTNENISIVSTFRYSFFDENSPFAGGNGGRTEEETGGTTLYCPPIKYEISMYGSKFNTGLCYSNTEEISGGQVISTTPITIFEAFPTYQAYVQAYNLITNNCHTSTVNTVEQCQEALQGIGKKPSEILLKVINSNIQEGVSLSKIYQYCHLQLEFTEEEKRNKSTCDLKEEGTYYASGVNSTTQSNPNPLQGMTDQLQDSTDIIIPEDGTIFDTILPDGIISWKDVIFDFDFWKHLTQLIGKMIILFKVRPIQTGILPPIITSLLLLVILFKIYKK